MYASGESGMADPATTFAGHGFTYSGTDFKVVYSKQPCLTSPLSIRCSSAQEIKSSTFGMLDQEAPNISV